MALLQGRIEPQELGMGDLAGDRGLMARSLAYLFCAGAGLALLSAVLPESLPGGELRLVAPLAAACAVGSALLVAVLVMGSDVLRLWTFQSVLAAGTVLITAAIHFSGEISAIYVMFYVWVTLYAFYFFSWVQAALQLAFLALAYSVVLFGAQLDDQLARWLVPVATLGVAGALVGTLKDRVRALVRKLADAARTDVLTGLANRRGFQELFERELDRAIADERPLCLVVGDLDHFKDLNDRFGHAGGDRALVRLGSVLSDEKRAIDAVARLGGEEFALLMPASDEHAGYIAAERLRREVRDAFDGGLTMSFGVAAFPRHGASIEAVMHAADHALYTAKELGRDRTVIYSPAIAGALAQTVRGGVARREAYLATVLALAEALDLRDAGTADHSSRVGHYAEVTARELGLPAHVVERIRVGGVLHDIGKVGVPEAVLRKSGPLDDLEWGEIRKHPEIGARILESVRADDLREWVLAHHERPDGSGYPRGLAGDAIPLEARILAVAEAYEAMTSPHVYRPALGEDEARAELTLAAGSQFDAEVVAALLRALDDDRSSGRAHRRLAVTGDAA